MAQAQMWMFSPSGEQSTLVDLGPVGGANGGLAVDAAGLSQETVAVYPNLPLDVPISLAFGASKDERGSLFVTNGGFSAYFIPWLEWAGPGLVKIEVGIPGVPLP